VVPGAAVAHASLFGTDVIGLPNGSALTPDAAPGARLFTLDPHEPAAPAFRASGAMGIALSPDGATLLLLTSGFNRTYGAAGELVPDGSREHVFVYDVSGRPGCRGCPAGIPRETQVLALSNSLAGIAFHPAGTRFYVSGGPDDVLHEYERDAATGDYREVLPPIALGHARGLGLNVSPFAAGIASSASGARLVVANHENDSVSVVDTRNRARAAEIELRPGGGRAGGEFPFGVVVIGESLAYVTSFRDREVVEVDLDRGQALRRIRVGGQPTAILADRAGTRLFVSNANSDTVSVVDRVSGRVIAEIPTAAPEPGVSGPPLGIPGELRGLRGSNPNALALSPDERTLYVTNGGNNTLAFVDLGRQVTIGLVPTGFYPHAVAMARDGRTIYVAHGKSAAGPNPLGPWSLPGRAQKEPYAPGAGNQLSLQLRQGGLLAFPAPSPSDLAKLTRQSLSNNRLALSPASARLLGGAVKHVILVIGENRTFDQVFGDRTDADGDRQLVLWGEPITPNRHALARRFVLLDRFFDAGGVSGDGWSWTLEGHTTDVVEKMMPIQYARRGHYSYDWEGKNRNVNVGLATLDARTAFNPKTPQDEDLLPGAVDVAAVDGPEEGGARGFLWDVAMAAGLRVRNYGCFTDELRYSLKPDDPARVPPIPMPFETKTRVAFPTRASLQSTTDPYFRGFDMNFADTRRIAEWAREWDELVANGNMPGLELVRLPHDHLGAFASAEDGVNTPDTQVADNDYAFGLLVERVSKSVYWKDTVIIAIEDDAQNGSDHVHAHRSFALFAGAHVRRSAVVSTVYSTPSVLRTIELLLGMPPLGQNDAVAPPMAELFDEEADMRPYEAIVPSVLRSTLLPLPGVGRATAARGDAAFWAEVMRGFDFRREDSLPTAQFNRALLCGLGARDDCVSQEAADSED
jgi:YVTN family beta-propeller protein